MFTDSPPDDLTALQKVCVRAESRRGRTQSLNVGGPEGEVGVNFPGSAGPS